MCNNGVLLPLINSEVKHCTLEDTPFLFAEKDFSHVLLEFAPAFQFCDEMQAAMLSCGVIERPEGTFYSNIIVKKSKTCLSGTERLIFKHEFRIDDTAGNHFSGFFIRLFLFFQVFHFSFPLQIVPHIYRNELHSCSTWKISAFPLPKLHMSLC